MPKRKRNSEPSFHDKLSKHLDEVFRALKAAKGFERQRLSKRQHEAGATPEKKERLAREISVLKNLDLHQTARAHLYSCLLKVKTIAASTDLPDEIRRGLSKPELPEEEKAALHNVTSGLYNREPVKQAIDRAIISVCTSLGVAAPEKGTKRSKKSKREEQEEQPADRIPKKMKIEAEAEIDLEEMVIEEEEEEEEEEVTDFEGFESDVDEPGAAVGDQGSKKEADEEEGISKFDDLLGSSSGEDDDELDEGLLAKYRGRETVNLDDISVSGSDAEETEGSESDVEEDATSRSPSPPPTRKAKDKHKERRDPGPTRAGETTFLPSLMGGYISGSESEASDIEVAPPKKRRGQRARQAIWEKKFGEKAKHLQQQTKGKGKGRDAGWDTRRGAVDGDERTPWKKGVKTPFAGRDAEPIEERRAPKPTKRDDEGKLHGSWEAAKKAKEAQKAAVFAGSKVTFD